MWYLEFLREVHRRLQPRTYVEIGVREGKSLALAQCRALGIDPAFDITAELDGDLAVVKTSSDEYFQRPNPLAPTRGQRFDMAFIDGLHIFEFALRDFLHIEQFCTANSLIVFDDMLPRSVDEAARDRHTKQWTGDVYGVLQVLERYRPDLSVLPVGTAPTGLLLVFGLDPANRVLSEQYDEIMAEYRHPDPQPVPEEVLDRLGVVSPHRLLESRLLDVLADRSLGKDPLRAELDDVLRQSFGPGFVRDSAAAAP